jgi:hypothetical protein
MTGDKDVRGTPIPLFVPSPCQLLLLAFFEQAVSPDRRCISIEKSLGTTLGNNAQGIGDDTRGQVLHLLLRYLKSGASKVTHGLAWSH